MIITNIEIKVNQAAEAVRNADELASRAEQVNHPLINYKVIMG